MLFDSRGNVLFRESSGASNYVKFSKEQLSKMKGATLTHNHPSSSTFSPADVSIMTEQGLNVIRATGTSKTYQLKKLNAGYIKGVTIQKYVTGETNVDAEDIRITLKGLEYLSENSIMQKMYKAAKGITDLIP